MVLNVNATRPVPVGSVAVGSIFTESNHLGGAITELSAFERQELCRGDEVLAIATGTVGGMLAELRKRQIGVVPLIVASTCPGGPISAPCYNQLKSELLAALAKALPLDGILLALHGAAAAQGVPDVEGDLLCAVRELVGPEIPIVATLDLHAHVTPGMVTAANALLAWETYPHRDSFETGIRGARMLCDIVGGRIHPAMVMAKVPVVVSGVHGHTEGPGPFADIMRHTKSLEGRDGVLSTSAFLVHPYLDVDGMGGGGLVITDGDAGRAESLAREIARLYWQRRVELDPPVHTPAEAIRLGQSLDGPVLLVETSDCCGGGAAGDSVATLRALMDARVNQICLVPVVDPAAAARCHHAGIGATLTIELGHTLDPRWGTPLVVRGRVSRLTNGKFRYSGGIWGGQTGDMGPTAVLDIGSIRVMVATHATYDWADEQYQSVQLDPASAHFIVVKNPMNYHLAYAGVAKHTFILDTPGPTPPVMHHVAFENLARPYYPADRDIPGLQPVVLRH